MIVSLAFRNVLRNKERSLLTLVGVVLAIGSFVALVSIAAGFTVRVERELGSREVHIYVTGSRASNLPVSPLAGAGSGGVSLPREMLEILDSQSMKNIGVRSVTPVIRTHLDGPRSVIPVIALPLQQSKIVFKGGRFEKDPRTLEAQTLDKPSPEQTSIPEAEPSPELLPTSTPSPAASLSPGPDVSPSPEQEPVIPELPSDSDSISGVEEADKHIVYPAVTGQGLERDVRELMAATDGVLVVEEIPFQPQSSMGSHGFLDYSVLVPIEAFFAQRPDRGVHEYWITVENEAVAKTIQAAIQSRLDEYVAAKVKAKDYAGARNIQVLTRRQYLRSAREYLNYGWLLQVAVSMVGVLIAITASMNTMLMSTYERLGEYATLRAVGASRRVVSLTIVFEAIFLNVTGGVLGLLFGFLATGVLDKAVALLLEIPYPMAEVTPALLLQALGLSFFVGLAGAIIPCIIVSRLDLVAQLRKGL